MAQLLKDRHSLNVHQNIVRRCMRLCRQVKVPSIPQQAIVPLA
jgi:hypothetical protein